MNRRIFLGRLSGACGILAGIAGVGVSATGHANPFFGHPGLPGFVILPEQRFDPAVQRFMAERSLRALPLQDGQLYYVFPVDASDAHIEQMQIRYLEALLEKERADDEPDGE